MSAKPVQLSLQQARRIALAAHGFSKARPTGRTDRRHLRGVLDHIALIQIDSVNVLVRSQELPLFSRLGCHDRSLIPTATKAGELFEYWGHEAAHVRTEHHRLWRWKMEQSVHGPWRSAEELLKKRRGYVEEVYQRVVADGPLAAGELSERTEKKGSWWDWDHAKLALEYLFMTGRLTATRRANDFARLYDLPERVIPAEHLRAPTPSAHDAHRELLDIAGRSVGVGTARDIADYFRIKFGDAKPRIDELVESGRLLPAVVKGSTQKVFVHADARVPRSIDARALLSMFDPVVWFRPRAEWLFDFHYRIEIYTPAPRRRYGYYVLPFLLGDELVARVDLKADRANGTLLVPGAFTEHHADPRKVAPALATELRDMATWLNLDDIRVGSKGNLAKPVRSALSSRVIVER
jgi:uncharacterized protein YcaQ